MIEIPHLIEIIGVTYEARELSEGLL